MTQTEFKKWQGTRTNPETAELLCCSLRLVEAMRQGVKPVSERTAKMIEREVEP